MGRLRELLATQEVAFLVVGALNVGIGLSWFVGLHLLLGERLGYMGTLGLAYAAAILCAFWLHRRFVFRVRGQVLVDLTRFTLVQLVSLGINALVLPLLVEMGGLPVVPAQMTALVVVVVFSYFAHLLFSFRRSHRSHRPSEPGRAER